MTQSVPSFSTLCLIHGLRSTSCHVPLSHVTKRISGLSALCSEKDRSLCSWTTSNSERRREQTSYSVCMLALVSSKAHSTDSGLSAVTLLHSICRFSLEWEDKSTREFMSLCLRENRLFPSMRKTQNKNEFHGTGYWINPLWVYKAVRTHFCRIFWRLGRRPGGLRAVRREGKMRKR